MADHTNEQRPDDKPAKNRSILINFVLDKSGSMGAIEDATISGFNEFKNDQAREEGEAFFTLTLFDTEFSTVCTAVPVREVPDLDRGSYRPNGCTSLYDAIGHTLRITDDFVAANRPDQVLFVVMTDGQENSSREYSRERIFSLIRDRQRLNDYEFIYLGANQDSYAVGRAMGLDDGRMLDYAHNAVAAKETLKRASDNVKAHRRHGKGRSTAFFSKEMEELGAVSAGEWKSMPASVKQRLIDDAEGASEHKG